MFQKKSWKTGICFPAVSAARSESQIQQMDFRRLQLRLIFVPSSRPTGTRLHNFITTCRSCWVVISSVTVHVAESRSGAVEKSVTSGISVGRGV